MQFGQKKKDAPDAGGTYLRRFKKGETKVRFLDESDDWNAYREHYTPDRKSFPCTEEDTCPGCTSENDSVRKASRKYATQVLLVKQQIVLPFSVPISLSDRLAVRAERNGGTLTNRDYVVLRSGDGFDTEYDVDQEDKYPVDLADLRKKITVEIQDCHKEAFEAVWGSTSEPKTPTNGSKPADDAAADVPPTDDSAEMTEADLRAMSREDLVKLCEKAELKVDEDASRTQLVDALLKAFGE